MQKPSKIREQHDEWIRTAIETGREIREDLTFRSYAEKLGYTVAYGKLSHQQP